MKVARGLACVVFLRSCCTSCFAAISQEGQIFRGEADTGEVVIAAADGASLGRAGCYVAGRLLLVIATWQADRVGVEFGHDRHVQRSMAAIARVCHSDVLLLKKKESAYAPSRSR